MGRHVARMGKTRNAYKWSQNLTGRNHPKRPGRRYENNIGMARRDTGWEGVDWIHLAQDKDQRRATLNTVMNLRVP